MGHEDAAAKVRFREDVGERGGMVDMETTIRTSASAFIANGKESRAMQRKRQLLCTWAAAAEQITSLCRERGTRVEWICIDSHIHW